MKVDRVIFAAGALYQMVLRWRTFNIDWDNTALCACAVNHARGGTIGYLRLNLWDLATTRQEAMTWWPPGIPALVSILIRLWDGWVYVEEPHYFSVALPLILFGASGSQ